MLKSIFKNINIHELIFISVLLLYCIARSIYLCFPDNDLWARLIVGSAILDGSQIMKHDIFSYLPTHIWYDHEWGSSIFIYGFFKLFGPNGILILKSILMFLIVFLIFKTIKLKLPKYTNPYNIIFYFFVLMASAYVLSGTIRCHLFTFMFFALYIFLLEKRRLQNFKSWWIFPIIMLFWANIHGGCIAGLGLLIMYTIGELLNKKPIDFYIKALFTSALVLFLNPYEIGYVIFLLHATTMNRELIAEWHNTFFDNNPLSFIWFKTYLYIMSVAGIFAIIKNCPSKFRDKPEGCERNLRVVTLKSEHYDGGDDTAAECETGLNILYKESIDKTKWIIIFTTLYLSIIHIKHQPFFVITAAVFLYDDLYSILGGLYRLIIYKIPKMTLKIDKILVNIKDVLTYLVIVYLSILMISVTIKSKPLAITNTSYPYYAIEFIKINNLNGNLFISFDWGSYAEYKLFPFNKISMDGRYEECFNPIDYEKIDNFFNMKNDNYYEIIEMYPPDLMVIEKMYPVYEKIKNNPNWFLVFEDEYTGVFVSDKLKRDKYLYPTTDTNYYEKTKFDKQFNFLKG